jgi:hypothetical protein
VQSTLETSIFFHFFFLSAFTTETSSTGIAEPVFSFN